MASNSFPIDPLQTQLVSPTTNVTAPFVAGPQPTGLSEGLRTFSKALGSAAEYAKARRFEEDKIKAGLYAAMGDVAPGLVSQEALLHNYNLLDENFVNKTLKQVEVFNDNGAQEIAVHPSLTKEEKAKHFATFLNNIKAQAKNMVHHNGEALGKLNVALDGYKYKWNHDIAQAEKLQRIQTTTEEAYTSTENQVNTGGDFSTIFLKKISENIKKTDLTPPFEIIGGVKYKTYPQLDADKTTYSILSNTALKYFRTRPELYRQLKARQKDYFNKKARTEEALLANGKTVLIGDDKSFSTLFKETDDKYDALLKQQDTENKKATETTYLAWLSGKLAREEGWKGIDGYTLFNIFGEDAPKYIKKAKTQLTAVRQGRDTLAYNDLVNEIAENPKMSKEYLDLQIHSERLDSEATSSLNLIFTENRNEIKNNITKLKEATPFLTFNFIYKQIENDDLKKAFLAEVKGKRKKIGDALSKKWLEDWLFHKSRVKYSAQIRSFMKEALRISLLSRRAITTKSVERTLRQGVFSETAGKIFTDDEIDGISTSLKDNFINGINDINKITNAEIIALEKKLNPGLIYEKPKK